MLSHPESALLLGATALVLTAFHGRSWIGMRSALFVGIGTLAVTSWWWTIVLSRYGVGTFLGAGGNIGGIGAVVALVTSPLTAIPGGPLIGSLFLLGVVVVWQVDRKFVLPAWLLAVVLLSRSFYVYSAPPIALFAGVGAARVLLPGLDSAMATRGVPVNPTGARAVRWFVASLLVLYGVGSSLQLGLPTLPRGEREAMAWVSANTPASAAVLVPTAREEGSSVDPTGDWFAALSDRRGLSPPQGTEWLGKYAAVEATYTALLACRSRDTACLEHWATGQGLTFDYVYVPAAEDASPTARMCCEEVLASLRSDDDYRLAYAADGVRVFERVGTVAAP